jgi:hypothetical protein
MIWLLLSSRTLSQYSRNHFERSIVAKKYIHWASKIYDWELWGAGIV